MEANANNHLISLSLSTSSFAVCVCSKNNNTNHNYYLIASAFCVKETIHVGFIFQWYFICFRMSCKSETGQRMQKRMKDGRREKGRVQIHDDSATLSAQSVLCPPHDLHPPLNIVRIYTKRERETRREREYADVRNNIYK